MSDAIDPREVYKLVDKIRSLLAGRNPAIQSAVLADLLAMWLAGHVALDGGDVSGYREALLANHIKLVRDLIEPNERMIMERAVLAATEERE